ncbi:YIP1 family protein [Mycoplasmatota bacterium]|nr:YIP1 family protein [Mycoplasmatota bacterium]
MIFEDLVKFPLYIISHPFKGYDDFKLQKKGKMYVALILLALTSLITILRFTSIGFIMNPNNPKDLNSIKLISFVLFPVLLFSIANWNVTTLFDGKGKLKDIFMMVCYSLFPYIIVSFFVIIASNYLTYEELLILNVIDYIGILGIVYLMFFGMICIHEYSPTKVFITTGLTIVAIGVILFIVLLIFTLIRQFYTFVYALLKEISKRY